MATRTAPDAPAVVPARHRWLNGLLATTLCMVAACVVQQAAVIVAADWSSSVTMQQIERWNTGETPYTPEQWEQARQALGEAIALTPKDAVLHDALGQLYSLQGRAVWTTGEPGSPELAAYQQALDHQRRSIALRPTHAMAWANQALYQTIVYAPLEEIFASWREASRLGPREGEVTQTLLEVVTQLWEYAPDDLRAWAETHQPGISARLDAKAARQQP